MELGQIVHGNPTGDYHVEPYIHALILYLIEEEIDWCGYYDPKIKGLTIRAYYRGDDPEEAAKPNLVFDFSPQEIRWYKHPRRGMTYTLDWTPQQWVEWFNKALEVINSEDN